MSPPEDLLHVAGVLAGVFDALAVPYAFGGALAQNYWGTVRATQDIDLLASVPKIRFDDLREALVAAEFVARAADGTPVALSVDGMAAEERDRHLITVYRGLVKVEVFFPFLPIQHSILRRAVSLAMGGRTVPITSAEDLIVLKMAFHREKDLRDVRSMLWSQKGNLDLAYLRTWASTMLASAQRDELERFIREYGA